MLTENDLHHCIIENVTSALAEDVGSGDLSAALIPEKKQVVAEVISREAATIAGRFWFNEVFRQVDDSIKLEWQVAEAEQVEANQLLVRIQGSAKNILTAERTALNFLQTLSSTATISQEYANKVANLDVKLLDTRKTLPNLRLAQKYAVSCGGCHNHRLGLYDAFLLKENHIAAAGGINEAITKARAYRPDKTIEIEVENQQELEQAVASGANIVMLDNFSLAELKQAVAWVDGHAKLEASGNITDETLVDIAKTGVDYISIGALTKHCQALDLSLRITKEL